MLLLVLVTSVANCVSAGDRKLAERAVDKIVEGETEGYEIAEVLGYPEQILTLDRTSLNGYLSRVIPTESTETMLPEGQYQVWTYSNWRYVPGPILIPSHETSRFSVLVINSNDVCVKRFFVEKARLGD
ncbi:MAG: hypothetical protein JSU72_00930 [Deltaproteobacteria bacterium]|nr:MAG: hypothetical protein JSU72_00930 [Deltaproteobacteria bacterium]